MADFGSSNCSFSPSGFPLFLPPFRVLVAVVLLAALLLAFVLLIFMLTFMLTCFGPASVYLFE
jgi:hypothetical protein